MASWRESARSAEAMEMKQEKALLPMVGQTLKRASMSHKANTGVDGFHRRIPRDLSGNCAKK